MGSLWCFSVDNDGEVLPHLCPCTTGSGPPTLETALASLNGCQTPACLHLPLCEWHSPFQGCSVKTLRQPSRVTGASNRHIPLPQHASHPEFWQILLTAVTLGGSREVFTELPPMERQVLVTRGKVFSLSVVSSLENTGLAGSPWRLRNFLLSG